MLAAVVIPKGGRFEGHSGSISSWPKSIWDIWDLQWTHNETYLGCLVRNRNKYLIVFFAMSKIRRLPTQSAELVDISWRETLTVIACYFIQFIARLGGTPYVAAFSPGRGASWVVSRGCLRRAHRVVIHAWMQAAHVGMMFDARMVAGMPRMSWMTRGMFANVNKGFCSPHQCCIVERGEEITLKRWLLQS